MIAAVRARYRGKDVPRCGRDCREAQDRKAYGCDADASEPVFESTCPRCRGTTDACPACKGSGIKRWLRCPSAIVTRDVWDLLDSYGAFDAHDVLPAPGGWMDQSRAWARWVRVIESERAAIEEENRPRTKTTQ